MYCDRLLRARKLADSKVVLSAQAAMPTNSVLAARLQRLPVNWCQGGRRVFQGAPLHFEFKQRNYRGPLGVPWSLSAEVT